MGEYVNYVNYNLVIESASLLLAVEDARSTGKSNKY